MPKIYLQDIELAKKSDIPDVSGKQDILVSGQNIKTINNQSILGSGNIDLEFDFLTRQDVIDLINEVIASRS